MPNSDDQAAPSTDDLMARVQRLTSQPSGQPAAPSTDDLMARVQKLLPSAAQLSMPPIREEREPGPGTQANISLATDPEQRARIAGAQLFPHLPPARQRDRIGYAPDGRMIAVGDDGNLFYVDPPRYQPSLFAPSTWVPSHPLQWGASFAGAALPVLGGTAGGLAAAPTSFVAAPAAAAGGAAAGDILRQELANRLDPQGGWMINPLQTGVEAGMSGAGQLAGAGILRLATRNPLGASALDLARAGPAATAADVASARAGRQGVALTPGQASGLPSLLSVEDVIASGAAGPQYSDVARGFYDQQRQGLQRAWENWQRGLTPAADKTEAALQFQQGAEDVVRGARQQANVAARPAYQAAQGAGQVMSPDLAQLAETPAVQNAMDAARGTYRNLYRRDAPGTPDFALWDLTKRQLDDAFTTATRAGNRTDAAAIDSLRQDLLTHLDTAYPSYATARTTAAPGQQLAARMEDVLGVQRGGALGTERARAIVAPVFDTNNPRAIAEARNAFNAAGRGSEWNSGVAAYLQDAFDAASRSEEGLNPSQLLRQVWRDPNRRAALQAAMDPQAFSGLENFMGTLQDVARARGMNSLTAPRLAAANALAQAATTPGTSVVRLAGRMTSPLRIADIPGAATDQIAAHLTERRIGQIAQRLFSPDGIAFLRRMGAPGIGKAVATTAAARFLGGAAGAALAPANDAEAANPLAYARP